MSRLKWPDKDPDEVLDYVIDWSERLGEDDVDEIASSTWVIPTGITKNSDSHTPTTTTAWLASGTAGETYEVTNRIVTLGGRTMDQSVRLKIKDR